MAKAIRPTYFITNEPSDNECSVCNELFTVPKLLPCGHVLCRNCLVTWLQSQPQAHCPLCRCPVVEPGKAAAASNNWVVVADGFPTDLAMVELVEAERLLSKDHQCCFCQKAKATCLCLDCHDLYCASCKNGHTNQKISRHHVMQDLTCLKADQLASHRPSPCSAHTDKACELYCPSHDTSMCTVCFASRHRSCPNVTDLQQKADESREVLQQLATKLAEAEKKHDQALTALNQQIQEKKKQSKANLAELKAACDRLKSSIDVYYQAVEMDHNVISNEMDDGKPHLLQRRGRVTSERGAVERMKGIKSHDAIIAMTSVMKKRISHLDLVVKISESTKVAMNKTLVVDKGMEKKIQQLLPNLGSFAATSAKKTRMQPQQPQYWNGYGYSTDNSAPTTHYYQQ